MDEEPNNKTIKSLNRYSYSTIQKSNKINNKNNNNKNKFFNAYISIKQMLILQNSFTNISFGAYLIKVNTIPNFIKIIKDLNILKVLVKKNNESNSIEELEQELNNNLNKYELEKDIEILYEYDNCKNMIKSNNENENEFIIVDELFCRVMKIKDYFYENRKVNINIEQNKFIYEIQFNSNKTIFFRQNQNGFYKFVEEKE